MNRFAQVAIFALAGLAVLTNAAHADGKTFISSLGGEKAVTVSSGKAVRKATEGMELHPGDKIRTGYHSSAKIQFPDGSKVLLGKDAQLEISAPRDEVEQVELQRGEVRGFVKKPERGGGNLKFLIRSRSAVMGVRGTDFVFEYDDRANSADLHTLHGTVDIARDETLMRTGGRREVEQNETVRSTAGSEIPLPEEFDPKDFMKSLTSREPELMGLAKADLGSFADEYPLPYKRGLDLKSFRLNGIYTHQSSGGYSLSPELSWDPGFIFSRRLALRAHLGTFLLNGRTLNDRFVALEYGGLAAFSITRWLDLEAGVGAETWLGNHGDSGLVEMGNVVYRLAKVRWIDRIFAGVTYYGNTPTGVPGGTSSNSALQLKLGLGIYF